MQSTAFTSGQHQLSDIAAARRHALEQAHSLVRERRYDEAADIYRAVLGAAPDTFDAVHNLGLILLQSNELEAGLRHLERAAALNPRSAEAWNNIGGALQALNRAEDSLKPYAMALALRPNYADAHNNLGAALRTLGLLPEAVGAFETAIAMAPDRPSFYRNLVESKRIAPHDAVVAALERLLPRAAELPVDEQIHLRFALGKAYDDCNEHARSFHHLEIGNSLRRQQIVYDERATLGLMTRIRRIFTSELLRDKAGAGDASPMTIFIVGMPRSGTTLVEQILASHPAVHGGGESNDLHTLVSGIEGFPESVPGLSRDALAQLGARYVGRMDRPTRAVAYITDKMPLNFRHLGLVRLALPGARIVHVRRDPLDTCFSCFSILFTGQQPYAYDLRELGRFYRAYAETMEHWRRVIPTDVLLDLCYEELVADFETTARRLLAHCGLEWHDSCRDFYATRRKVRTASAVQVRQPLYAASVGRAKPYRAYLQPLIEALAGR